MSKTKNEELNTRLYKKMFAEQEEYENWLLTQPPKDILNHSYEYTVRNDIVLALEYNDLTDEQCEALLKLPDPLSCVFRAFEKIETGYMEDVFNTIVCLADDKIKEGESL